MAKNSPLTRLMTVHLKRIAVGILLFLSACAPASRGFVSPHRLASFRENSVSVEIALQQDASKKTFLTATFTPGRGDHLYSKDLARNGLFGEGRPTLLELTPQSQMRALGELTTNAVDEVSTMGSDALLVYPPGPVTVRLQVSLPSGSGWHNDLVSVTYMACSPITCRPPVIGKVVSVRVPGSAEVGP
jgi:hypothetical protein